MKYEGHLEAFFNKIYTANTEQHPSVYCDSVTMFITDTFSFNSCSRTNLNMKGSWMFAQTYLYSNWVNMDKTLLTLYSLIVKDNKIQDVGTPLHANDANFLEQG